MGARDVDTDNHLEMQPVPAESWEVSEDHLSRTVRLRLGVTLHDGSGSTAEDVEAVDECTRTAPRPVQAIRSRGVSGVGPMTDELTGQLVTARWSTRAGSVAPRRSLLPGKGIPRTDRRRTRVRSRSPR
ncbi:UNVERIFIED_CONTAM: hypothetical protein RF653_12585 [Kocuria sp. CPCC 205316]|uniref:ABC transporter substrate-binding protein n=1 Tax=Kocuria TaxID=57493 RepID=UPI0036DCF140